MNHNAAGFVLSSYADILLSTKEHVHYFSSRILNTLQLLDDEAFKSTDLTST